MQYKTSIGRSEGYLEFWPPGEVGTPDRPRPEDFDINRPGVEIFSEDTRPIDVMGDIASHYLIEVDPIVKNYYNQFIGSLTKRQRDILKEQYQYSRENFGENRPFDQWLEMSGLPGYFRGYAFQQWEDAESMYTPEQLKMFDKMMQYLRTGVN